MTVLPPARAQAGTRPDASPAAPRAARQNDGRPTAKEKHRPAQPAVPEIGGQKGPEPTRYGDWEKGGRCTDF